MAFQKKQDAAQDDIDDIDIGDIKMTKKDKEIFFGICAFVVLTLLVSYLQYKLFNKPPELVITISNFICLIFFVYVCYIVGRKWRA